MTTLNELFIEYLHRIQPSDQAVERAKSSHIPLREDLEKDENYGPFVETTRLAGSYARDTAILSIKDVDVVIKTTFTEDDLHERVRTNETLQECFLRLTKEAIKRTGRDARSTTARRSIYVKLPEDAASELPEMTMDIVPVRIVSDKDTDPMIISDRELTLWMDTYPNSQLADSTTRNSDSSYIVDRHHYKPLVKIFKAWKKVNIRSSKTPKGFVQECLTAKHHDPNSESWIDATITLFQQIADEWPNPDLLVSVPTVSDISNSSMVEIGLARASDLEAAKKFLKKVHTHLPTLEQAKQEEIDGDIEKAARTLQRVFGNDNDPITFPMPDDLQGSAITSSRSNVKESPPFA